MFCTYPHPVTPEALTAYLDAELPLAAALGLEVVHVGTNLVRMRAPFQLNRNGHGTAFGGSLATLGILCGWALAHARLIHDGMEQGLVIRSSDCDYHAPIADDIVIESTLDEAEWQRARTWLAQHGKARLKITSLLRAKGAEQAPAAAVHHGGYVMVAPHRQGV
jgi:thioesterase domain-containing protein